MRKELRHNSAWLAALALVASTAGCMVPQPLGHGREMRIKEPTMGGEYYLYLPEAYVKNDGVYPGNPNRLWPLVVTFHGLKPWDTWDRQVHEWEHEADTYGYVVCAPYLQTCDGIFMEFPLRKEHSYVLHDKETVMACLDHVLQTTRADPKAVLSTSWSSGGFMANYFPNRFPNRFRAIATRLGNFSSDIMIDSTVPLYRDMPIAVFIGDSDFPACIEQSKKSVAWYKARGFTHVEGKVLDSTRHRRIPQTAAAFFARQLGIEPLNPAEAAATLADLRMSDWEPDAQLLASVAPQLPLMSGGLASAYTSASVGPPNGRSSAPNPNGTSYNLDRAGPSSLIWQSPPDAAVKAASTPAPSATWPGTNGQPTPEGSAASAAHSPRGVNAVVNRAGAHAGPAAGSPPRMRKLAHSDAANYRPRTAGPQNYPVERLGKTTPPAGATVAMKDAAANPPPAVQELRTSRTVNIRLGGPARGDSPFYVAFSTDLPADLLDGADFLWTHNGAPICDAPRGVKVMDTPGVHRLAVLVISKNGQEFRGSTNITVRDRTQPNQRTDASVGQAFP